MKIMSHYMGNHHLLSTLPVTYLPMTTHTTTLIAVTMTMILRHMPYHQDIKMSVQDLLRGTIINNE